LALVQPDLNIAMYSQASDERLLRWRLVDSMSIAHYSSSGFSKQCFASCVFDIQLRYFESTLFYRWIIIKLKYVNIVLRYFVVLWCMQLCMSVKFCNLFDDIAKCSGRCLNASYSNGRSRWSRGWAEGAIAPPHNTPKAGNLGENFGVFNFVYA